MKSFFGTFFASIVLLLITGCATPVIDSKRFPPPKSVAIADFPDMVAAASIEIMVLNWPAPYFAGRFDHFFSINGQIPVLPDIAYNSEQTNQFIQQQIHQQRTNYPQQKLSIGQAGLAAGIAGGIAGAIQVSAEETQKRAAEFPDLVRKTMPGTDLRLELLGALRTGLEARQIQVQFIKETRNYPIRLFWPVKDAKGDSWPVGPFAANPPIDVDLVVQLAPIAAYIAPGPLNAYRPSVGIAVAVFNGRTREFLGWQAVYYTGPNHGLSYHQYDSLVAEVEKVGPFLRQTLLSLVPDVVRIISAEKKP